MSDTCSEYVGDGYSVTIQHCEFVNEAGVVCNELLGVNYPSELCDEHRTKK